MKEDRLIYLLESLLGKSKSARGGDEAVFSCPNCNHHKKKLTLNKLTQKYQCWVCGFKGARALQLLKFIKAPYTAFQELKEIDAQYKFKATHVEKPKDQLQLPEGFITLLKGKGLTRDKAYHYLKSRGVTAQDIIKYNIGYIEEGKLANFIIIPSYDDKGLLNYFVGRSFVGEKMKYKNPNVSRDIVPFDWYIAWSKPIVLCEGVFDAMSIRSNAIPMLIKKPSKSLLRKRFEKKVKTIYIALDDDAKKDAYNMSEFFRDFGIDCKVVKLPTDKDPNDLGWEKITSLIHTTESASFSDSIQAKLYG